LCLFLLSIIKNIYGGFVSINFKKANKMKNKYTEDNIAT
jgi:hypothetical protein